MVWFDGANSIVTWLACTPAWDPLQPLSLSVLASTAHCCSYKILLVRYAVGRLDKHAVDVMISGHTDNGFSIPTAFTYQINYTYTYIFINTKYLQKHKWESDEMITLLSISFDVNTRVVSGVFYLKHTACDLWNEECVSHKKMLATLYSFFGYDMRLSSLLELNDRIMNEHQCVAYSYEYNMTVNYCSYAL